MLSFFKLLFVLCFVFFVAATTVEQVERTDTRPGLEKKPTVSRLSGSMNTMAISHTHPSSYDRKTIQLDKGHKPESSVGLMLPAGVIHTLCRF